LETEEGENSRKGVDSDRKNRHWSDWKGGAASSAPPSFGRGRDAFSGQGS
jgi:hypothetical protein